MNPVYGSTEFLNSNQSTLFSTQITDDLVKSKIHLRIQQRNGKKSITTCEGLEDDLDIKRICKAMRKQFNCNGNITEVKETGNEVIQLQGDQRENIRNWLLEQEIIIKSESSRIVVHGF